MMQGNDRASAKHKDERIVDTGIDGGRRESLGMDRWWCLMMSLTVLSVFFAARANQSNLNTDAIAYAQVARHWVEGRWDLAISGYWGPLLSFIAVPLVWVGIEPLAATRWVVGGSGVLFWIASSRLFRMVGERGCAIRFGEVLVALSVTAWVGENVSPDLLLGSFLILASSDLVKSGWWNRGVGAMRCGVYFGLAYWSKGIGLTMGLGLVLAVGLLRWFETRYSDGSVAAGGGPRGRVVAITLGCSLAVALPWVSVLTWHYGVLTVSKTGRIAHAVVGPEDVDRYHPFARSFYVPPRGRITSWEDPSDMAYRYWSPLESRRNALHQVGLMGQNAVTAFKLLGSFELTGLSIFAGLLSCGVAMGRMKRGKNDEVGWTWAWVMILCGVGPYLLVYIKEVDQRYLYWLFPWILLASFGGIGWVVRTLGWERRGFESLRRMEGPLGWVVFGVFLVSVLPTTKASWMGYMDPASYFAGDVSGRMRRAGIRGTMAGSGMIAGGRTGLYVAYLLGEAWHGDKDKPTPDEVYGSEASLFVAGRSREIAMHLARDPRFESLDPRLFATKAEADEYPLQLFRIARSAETAR